MDGCVKHAVPQLRGTSINAEGGVSYRKYVFSIKTQGDMKYYLFRFGFYGC